ncbi:hypothetical protein B566_EDAN006625 [Ephemera danica]|nr:hypothetical protein B566_EDAN006625 [Ephemera danica]
MEKSPPSTVEITGHAANSKIEIHENQQLRLECVARNAKPPPTIVWYRGNVELKLAPESHDETRTEVTEGGRVKRYNVASSITITPTAEDDYTDYTILEYGVCEYRTVIRDPPGAPYIEGYTEGETIRRGQTVELACRSRGGNPAAQLIWYKNDEQIRMAYRSNGRFSENVHTFTAEASDNHAKYRCEASNVMSAKPLRAEVELSVLFAPNQVTISGPTEARQSDRVPLTCTTSNSNPPAEIRWMAAGKQLRDATSRTVAAPDGGWVTTIVQIRGLNYMKLNLFADPPLQPAIHGYTEGVSIAKGTVQHISCISTGGNPPATLTWYKNDQKINSTTKSSDKSVSAELNIVASAADNGARYRCEATNSATEVPLHEVITLDVNFAPEHVKIRQEPDKLRPGQRATLTCETSASKPPAHLTWWRSGIPVNTAPGATSNATRAGLYGGKVTSSSLTLDVTPDMNGLVYTCQATNEALQVSAHDATTLNIVYKPTFENEPPVGLRQVTAVEGEGTMIQLEPRANPPSMTFTWSKDGHPLAMNARVITDGAALNITTVRKDDAGTYSLEAVNSEGSTTAKIVLSVHYPPVILEIPRSVLVAESEDATISCTADGNPLVEANFQWKREDFDLASRTTQSFRNGTSYLRVIGTTTEDMGNFECHVSNGVGEPTMAKSMLLVKHKPKMDLSPSIAKAASNAGDMGRLICRAQGAPSVGFNWSREGSPIHPEVSDYFSVEYKEVSVNFISYSNCDSQC